LDSISSNSILLITVVDALTNGAKDLAANCSVYPRCSKFTPRGGRTVGLPRSAFLSAVDEYVCLMLSDSLQACAVLHPPSRHQSLPEATISGIVPLTVLTIDTDHRPAVIMPCLGSVEGPHSTDLGIIGISGAIEFSGSTHLAKRPEKPYISELRGPFSTVPISDCPVQSFARSSDLASLISSCRCGAMLTL